MRLCGDVLFEVLCYGDRCRLTKLERVGGRFHRIVENFFGRMPSLRLNLSLKVKSRFLFFKCSEIMNFQILIDRTFAILNLWFLSLNQIYFSYRLKAFIGNKSKAISLADLKAFPQFLRLGEITLDYRESQLAIEEKC